MSRSDQAWQAFRKRVGELGGSVLETAWLGSTTPHRVRCPDGHEATPIPSRVMSGRRLCPSCVLPTSIKSEAEFRARIVKLGATILETKWLGSEVSHRVRCVRGHETTAIPTKFKEGRRLCGACPTTKDLTMEEEFLARVVALGGVVLETTWLGNRTPHRVRCAEGHENTPTPSCVRGGGGICRTCAGQDSAVVEAAFRKRVVELGGTVLEPVWLGANAPHRVRCAEGHERTPTPSNVRQGRGICGVCSGNDSASVEADFRARVVALGGVVLETTWLGNGTPHRVRCAEGHENTPTPSYVRGGGGICRTCAGQDSAVVEAAFRKRVVELGGTVLEPVWLGFNAPHRVRCAIGHEVTTRPESVRVGGNICRTCSGRDSVAAWNNFRAKVKELGGTVLETEWLGARIPHRVRCTEGHLNTPSPMNVKRGTGICLACSGRDSAAAEAVFRARVGELGGTILEAKWLGANTPHRVRCIQGHEVKPRPKALRDGSGLCRACAGCDPKAAAAAFRVRVAELGGELLELTWQGNHTPHLVRCSQGHETKVRPSGTQQGQGLCRKCKGKEWDVFYVVHDAATVKFGITSGSARPRLRNHAADGYTKVTRLLTQLPGNTAPELETLVKSSLRMAGEKPIRGTEYFSDSVTALVLDIVDNHPVVVAARIGGTTRSTIDPATA